MKMLFIDLALCLTLSACTISVTTIHSQGQATDLIDQDQKADAQVSPDISIPLVEYDFGGKDVGLVWFFFFVDLDILNPWKISKVWPVLIFYVDNDNFLSFFQGDHWSRIIHFYSLVTSRYIAHRYMWESILALFDHQFLTNMLIILHKLSMK